MPVFTEYTKNGNCVCYKQAHGLYLLIQEKIKNTFYNQLMQKPR